MDPGKATATRISKAVDQAIAASTNTVTHAPLSIRAPPPGSAATGRSCAVSSREAATSRCGTVHRCGSFSECRSCQRANARPVSGMPAAIRAISSAPPPVIASPTASRPLSTVAMRTMR